MKVREAIKLVENDGWYLVRTRGSHRQYKHPDKKGLVTIPGKMKDDLAPATINSILKQGFRPTPPICPVVSPPVPLLRKLKRICVKLSSFT